MKKKSLDKSKERHKNKNDETKIHKHSRRKRKSSASESDGNSSEATNEYSEDVKSRRNITKKNEKETENNAMSSTRITRHSKRLAAISAGSEEVKEEISDILSSPVKTGKSSPFYIGSPSKDPKKKEAGTPEKHKTKEQDVWKVKSANGAGSGELQKLKICRQRSPENVALSENLLKNSESENAEEQNPGEIVTSGNIIENNTTNIDSINEKKEIHILTAEEISNIQLPSADPTEESSKVSQVKELTKLAESENEITNDLTKIEKIVTNKEDSVVPDKDTSHELKSSNVSEKISSENTDTNKTVPLNVNSDEDEIKKISETEELKQSDETNDTKLIHQEYSELEDISQTELVLTVEETVIDEPITTSVILESCEETLPSTKNVETEQVEIMHPVLKQVEIEEIYDYENDDTKEEGELSANESMSPIYEVFKKYSADMKKRSWGLCSVSHFTPINEVVNEHILNNLNIMKRTISKEDFDMSDSEDLIFVKEIREENIVHEIESETNITSYVDKDDDNIPSSSEVKFDNIEINRKKTLENDRISHDKQSKRYLKENKLRSGEGKTVLYICNLVRPFTVNQLRELLLRTGRIVEDGFWIDSIKSKCYVQFETEDEALETRHALHGIRWPVNNPKVLNVQFATQDDLLTAQAQTHESEIPRKTEPLVVSNHSVEQTQKRIDWKKHFEQYDERPRKIKDVREWDIGKPAHPDDMIFTEIDDFKQKEDQEKLKTGRRDKRRRNEISDEEFSTKKQRKTGTDVQPPTEAKLLDDLFRRTKASPSIYWLPLSDEQIAIKQETRRKHLEDIDRQMKRRGDNRDSRRRDKERRSRR